MAQRPETIEFQRADSHRVVARMGQLAASHLGWINLQPGVRGEEVSNASSLMTAFGRRPAQLTLATWTAGEQTRKGLSAATVGLQHSRPLRVRGMLAEKDLSVPEEWQILQDAPRRGFVARLPDGADHADVLSWLLDAVDAVSPVSTTGHWRAMVHWADAAPDPHRRPGRFGFR